MTEAATTVERAVESFSTSLRRARCVRPVLVERMVSSLGQHGQLTPVVGVRRGDTVELVDGFKRYEAAQRLGLKTLTVSVTAFDEMGQWTAMLLLNRGPQSMTELEEALVIREMLATRTQEEVGQMVHRHKSWVSRRVGLVERLHPELVESIRIGMLHPGVARRLQGLPRGNQLQLAAAAQSAHLGPRDTELLVRLWQRAPDAEVRKQLLAQAGKAVKTAFRESTPPAQDSRLSAAGQQLSRTLHQVSALATRALRMLPPTEADLAVLVPTLAKTEQAACLLASALGRHGSGGSKSGNGGNDGTS